MTEEQILLKIREEMIELRIRNEIDLENASRRGMVEKGITQGQWMQRRSQRKAAVENFTHIIEIIDQLLDGIKESVSKEN